MAPFPQLQKPVKPLNFLYLKMFTKIQSKKNGGFGFLLNHGENVIFASVVEEFFFFNNALTLTLRKIKSGEMRNGKSHTITSHTTRQNVFSGI